MNVRDLTHGTHMGAALNNELVEVMGWLVVIDENLFLLDENLADPYDESKKIMISDPFIAYSVRDVISPLGGGKSFVFHRAKIVGVLEGVPLLQINVRDLLVENDSHEFVHVALGEEDIKRAREKYGDRLMKQDSIKSDDWLDYF